MVKEKNTSHKSSSIYTCTSFYMLRVPVLAADIYKQITDANVEKFAVEIDNDDELDSVLIAIQLRTYNVLKNLITHSEIEQALAVASMAIFDGLAYIKNQDAHISSRRIKRLYSSILRYLVRMSTRPTPFGLFSGVSVGTFANETTMTLATPPVKLIRTRPDMGWLLSIIERIEKEPSLIPQLHIMVNSTVYIAGDRAIIPYADVYGKGDSRSIALRATPIIHYILEHAIGPIPYNELRLNLLQAFPKATEQQVDILLKQLWEYHFLVSNLRPPLTNPAPAHYILDRIQTIPEAASIYNKLKDILEITSEIDNIGFGGPVTLIENLAQKAEELQTYNYHSYQIDTALLLQNHHIHKSVGEAAAQAAEILLRLGNYPQGLHHLKEYYSAFVERYGMEAEVPLLELLSPEIGLDAPPSYTEPARSYPLKSFSNPRSQERDSILSSILVQALNKRAIEVELNETLLNKLTQWTPKASSPPPSTIDVYLQLHASSLEALNKGDWRAVISPNSLALGGRTFGRFFDIFNTESQELLKEYVQREEALLPNIIFAELSYLPHVGRAANVILRPSLRAYEIVVNTTPSVPLDKVIPLDDLVVGVYPERFYIRSKRLNKEVRVVQSHMLNMMRAPNVCRFLLEVAQDGCPALSSFDWGAARMAPFLPRIVQDKIVLSPAQWRLQLSDIILSGPGSESTRKFNGVQQWRKEWHVPRYVYLTELDNRLLLDLEHPLLLEELFVSLKKAGDDNSVILQEMMPDFGHLWLHDTNDAAYISEIVVPLIINQQELIVDITHPTAHQYVPQRDVLTYNERRQLPGDEWVFLKLYAATKRHNEIITGPIQKIVQILHKQALIDRWFFIRYADPEPHLRIRFHFSDTHIEINLLAKTLIWARELAERGVISRFSVDTYDREIERYGGPAAINMLEQVFMADSTMVSNLISTQYTKQITLDPLAIAVFSLDQLFANWGLSLTERLKYIQIRTDKYEYIDAFRPHRKHFCELVALWDSDYDETFQKQRELLYKITNDQANIIKKISREVHNLSVNKVLWEKEERILEGIAHMHVNRFLGINRDQEKQIYAFWRYTLESIQHHPKYTNILKYRN